MALLSDAFTSSDSSETILLSVTLETAFTRLSFLYHCRLGGGLPPAELHCSFSMEPEMSMSPLL